VRHPVVVPGKHERVGRAALLILGLFVGLLLTEGFLRIAAMIIARFSRTTNVASTGEGQRVLATGDSNTYGLYVEGPEAWPARFESVWNAQHPERQVRVMNAAFPGMNSSRLRNALPRLLQGTRADVVTIMIGANDF
jgi:lysophospholipase L1-like esterase